MGTKLIFARYFATMEHVRLRGHTHGGLPYTHHLMAVEEVLRRFGLNREEEDDDLLVAAWLHDVVEDCEGIKTKHIVEMFGHEVADLVEAVTDEPGPNRKARKLGTYEKIRQTPDAVILKLADRIANVEAGGNLVEMYRKEHPTFAHGLLGSPTNGKAIIKDRMWEHLTALLKED